jgi:hypothetical protein
MRACRATYAGACVAAGDVRHFCNFCFVGCNGYWCPRIFADNSAWVPFLYCGSSGPRGCFGDPSACEPERELAVHAVSYVGTASCTARSLTSRPKWQGDLLEPVGLNATVGASQTVEGNGVLVRLRAASSGLIPAYPRHSRAAPWPASYRGQAKRHAHQRG